MARRRQAATGGAAQSAVVRPRRSVMMTEKYRALEALPVEDHNAFLARFYEANPTYPWPESKCGCATCLSEFRAGA